MKKTKLKKYQEGNYVPPMYGGSSTIGQESDIDPIHNLILSNSNYTAEDINRVYREDSINRFLKQNKDIYEGSVPKGTPKKIVVFAESKKGQDEFQKVADTYKKWAKSRNIPIEIVAGYGSKKVNEFISKINKDTTPIILGHSGNKIGGVPLTDWEEKMSGLEYDGNCILGSCGGDFLSRQLPSIRNLSHNFKSAWWGPSNNMKEDDILKFSFGKDWRGNDIKDVKQNSDYFIRNYQQGGNSQLPYNDPFTAAWTTGFGGFLTPGVSSLNWLNIQDNPFGQNLINQVGNTAAGIYGSNPMFQQLTQPLGSWKNESKNFEKSVLDADLKKYGAKDFESAALAWSKENFMTGHPGDIMKAYEADIKGRAGQQYDSTIASQKQFKQLQPAIAAATGLYELNEMQKKSADQAYKRQLQDVTQGIKGQQFRGYFQQGGHVFKKSDIEGSVIENLLLKKSFLKPNTVPRESTRIDFTPAMFTIPTEDGNQLFKKPKAPMIYDKSSGFLRDWYEGRKKMFPKESVAALQNLQPLRELDISRFGEPYELGEYENKNNTIRIRPSALNDETMTHELTHQSQFNINSDVEPNVTIYNHLNKTISPFIKSINESNLNEDAYYYLSDPKEVHARLMTIRQKLNLKPNQKVTPELFTKKIKELKGKHIDLKELRQVIKSDDAIIELLNTVVDSSTAQEDYPVLSAQQGGLIQQALGYKDVSPYKNLPFQTINSNRITMDGVSRPLLLIPDNDQPVIATPNSGEYQFSPQTESVLEIPIYAEGGGIPQRYRNMGFTRVGQKKQSTRDGKKWMVLAKKGDKYKVVHGGAEGMSDYTKHKDEDRRDRFWKRHNAGSPGASKDPFSPLYWHKKFGTWEDGGNIGLNNYEENKEHMKIYQQGGLPSAQMLQHLSTIKPIDVLYNNMLTRVLADNRGNIMPIVINGDGADSSPREVVILVEGKPVRALIDSRGEVIEILEKLPKNYLLNRMQGGYNKITNPINLSNTINPLRLNPQGLYKQGGVVSNLITESSIYNRQKETKRKNPVSGASTTGPMGGKGYADKNYRASNSADEMRRQDLTINKQFVPLQSLIPIQAEKDELIVHPTGDITPVMATKRHHKMDEDEVTDFATENSYILSAHGDVKIYKDEAINLITETGVKPYRLGQRQEKPTEKTLADIMTKKVMSPAEVGNKITKLFPVKESNNPFEIAANNENKVNRRPYLEAVVGLSEFDKERKGINNSIEQQTQMQQGGTPSITALFGGGSSWGGIPISEVMQRRFKPYTSLKTMQQGGSPKIANIPHAVDPLTTALVGAGTQLFSGIFGAIGAARQRRESERAFRDVVSIADRSAAVQRQNVGMGAMTNIAATLAQDPTVDPTLLDPTFVRQMQFTTPMAVRDAMATRAYQNMPNRFYNAPSFAAGLAASQADYANALKNQYDAELKIWDTDRNARNQYLTALQGYQDKNAGALVDARNATRLNRNQQIGNIGGIGQGYFNSLADIDAALANTKSNARLGQAAANRQSIAQSTQAWQSTAQNIGALGMDYLSNLKRDPVVPINPLPTIPLAPISPINEPTDCILGTRIGRYTRTKYGPC